MSDGVVFLPSFHEAIRDLPDVERLGAYDAVVRYGLYGELVDMSPAVKSLFTLMKPVIDSSQRRYRAAKENGRKGGAPPGNQNARKKQPESNQTHKQRNDQEKEKDSDYEMEIESDFDMKRDSYSEIDREDEGEIQSGGGETAHFQHPLPESRSERAKRLGISW